MVNLIPFATGILRTHWKLIATAGVILALLAYAWTVTGQRNGVRREYALFREAVTARAAEALAKQMAVNAAQERKWKDVAHDADTKHERELGDALTRADRYIAANRVLRQAGGSAGGGTSAAAEADSASGDNGPGAVADLVAVTADDVRICTVNTKRLMDARDWALSLE